MMGYISISRWDQSTTSQQLQLLPLPLGEASGDGGDVLGDSSPGARLVDEAGVYADV